MPEQNVTVTKLGTTLIAAFIGAALVSGKEIWQFFGIYGVWGLIGLSLAMGLLGLFSYMLLTVARKSGITDMTRVLFGRDHPIPQLLIGSLQAIFMLGIYAVMLSAAGALFTELFPQLPAASIIGSAVLLILTTAVVLFGVDGIVKIFSLLTPVLVFFTVLIAVWSLIRYGANFAFPVPKAEAAPLHNNWFLSALNFVSYNFFCAIGILAPLGIRAKTQKTVLGGSILGGSILFAIAASIFIALCTVQSLTATDLPMLTLSGNLSPVIQYVYAALLLFGMFAASVSVTFPLPDFLQNELHIHADRRILIPLISAVAFPVSFSKFGVLIDYLYPVFGYLALIVLALLIIRFVKQKDHL